MIDEELKILIVDGNPATRFTLRTVIESVGPVFVLEASDMADARAALEAHDVAGAFVDIQLSQDPNRDGITLVRHIRESTPTVPLVISGGGHMTEVRAAMRAGVFDYIVKEEISEEIVLSILVPRG